MNNILFEKYKDILEKLDFERNYYSRTGNGIYIETDMIINIGYCG